MGLGVGFCIPRRAQRDQPPKSIGTRAKKAGPFLISKSSKKLVWVEKHGRQWEEEKIQTADLGQCPLLLRHICDAPPGREQASKTKHSRVHAAYQCSHTQALALCTAQLPYHCQNQLFTKTENKQKLKQKQNQNQNQNQRERVQVRTGTCFNVSCPKDYGH